MKRHGTSVIGWPRYSELVRDFSELGELPLPSAHTILLIAGDARGVDRDVIARSARRLLASGLVYVCVWGSDCSRVHDIFDIEAAEANEDWMSTWHDDEPLEEALWFFLMCAFPPEEHPDTRCLAVSIGNSEWDRTINETLANEEAFISRRSKELDA